MSTITGSGSCKAAECQVTFFVGRSTGYNVMATDYENYAVIYYCYDKEGEAALQTFQIIGRKPTLDEASIKAISEVIQSSVPYYDIEMFQRRTYHGNHCKYLAVQ